MALLWTDIHQPVWSSGFGRHQPKRGDTEVSLCLFSIIPVALDSLVRFSFSRQLLFPGLHFDGRSPLCSTQDSGDGVSSVHALCNLRNTFLWSRWGRRRYLTTSAETFSLNPSKYFLKDPKLFRDKGHNYKK